MLVRIVIVVGGSAVATESNRRPIGISLGVPGTDAVGERLGFQLVVDAPSDILDLVSDASGRCHRATSDARAARARNFRGSARSPGSFVGGRGQADATRTGIPHPAGWSIDGAECSLRGWEELGQAVGYGWSGLTRFLAPGARRAGTSRQSGRALPSVLRVYLSRTDRLRAPSCRFSDPSVRFP